MAHMGLYITDSTNFTMELPVNPKELMIKTEIDGESVTVIGLGEIKRLSDRKLKTLSITSTIPIVMSDAYWTTGDNLFDDGQEYINWLDRMANAKKPVRVVLSDSKINLLATVDSFDSGFKDGNSIEFAFTLELTEYRDYRAKRIKVTPAKTTPKKGQSRPQPNNKIGRGSTVVVNGQLYRDSAGHGPGLTEHNATRKISIVATGAKMPYHITTTSGAARGWVSASSVKAK
ncbi:hypothetical protein [Lacticaseibacillus saniviri]|nr:hypothetical protein [Lacticaseibacillus saniviri]